MKRIVSITEQLCNDLKEIAADEMKVGRRNMAVRVPPKVLVVEDNSSEADLMESVLRAMGCEVHLSQSGDAAISKLAAAEVDRDPFGITFLDLRLTHPGPQGLDVLKYAHENCPQMPVILVTGYATPDLLHNRTLGYFSVVEKPLEVADLKDILTKHRLQ